MSLRGGYGEASGSTWRIVGLLVLVGIVIAAAAFLGVRSTLSGSKTQLAESFFLAVLPALIYVAVTKPFVFPFSLFVVLIPIDNLLGINALQSGAIGSSQHVTTITKVIGVAAGFAFIFWFIRTRKALTPPAASLVWLGVLVWMALSMLWALDTNVALSALITYMELIGLLFIVSVMPVTLLDLKTFIGAVVLGGIVTCCYSLYQFHAGGGIVHADLNRNPKIGLAADVGGIDPNALSAALLLPVSVMTSMFLRVRLSWAKLGYGILLALLLAGVFVAASRGGIVALVGLFGYFLFRSRYRLQMLTLSALAIGASLARGVSSGVWGRFADAQRTGGSGRTSIWKVGFDAFRHHWLLGAGVGNFPVAYDKSFIHVFEFYNQGWHRVSHNTPLGLAVELGIVGLALAGTAGYLQFKMLNFIGKSDPLYDLRIGLEAAFFSLCIACVFLWVLPGKFTWLTLELMVATRTFAISRQPYLPWSRSIVLEAQSVPAQSAHVARVNA